VLFLRNGDRLSEKLGVLRRERGKAIDGKWENRAGSEADVRTRGQGAPGRGILKELQWGRVELNLKEGSRLR